MFLIYLQEYDDDYLKMSRAQEPVTQELWLSGVEGNEIITQQANQLICKN